MNFKNKLNQNPRTYKFIKAKARAQRKSSYLALTKPCPHLFPVHQRMDQWELCCKQGLPACHSQSHLK